MESRKLISLCMCAKLSSFKDGGFGEATTISWILEIVIFNMHCVRADLSLYKHPKWRVTPSNRNIKSHLSIGLKKYTLFQWNIRKYYEFSFFFKELKKTYQIFCGYVRELNKKKIPRSRNVPTKMHSVSNSSVSSPNCIIPLKIIYFSNQELEF